MEPLATAARLVSACCTRLLDVRASATAALGVVMLSALWLFGSSAYSASLEYEIKAAYLAKFAQFVDWPPDVFASPRSSFDICIVGDDPFGRVLDEIAGGEEVNSHPVVVVRMQDLSPQSDCHILFAAAGASRDAQSVLRAAAHEPILTVTDGEPGGIIELVVKDGRVRFEIDESQARANRIPISSKLLALADVVR